MIVESHRETLRNQTVSRVNAMVEHMRKLLSDETIGDGTFGGDEKAAASGIKRVKIRKSLVRGDGMVPAEAAHLFVIVIFFSIILRDRSRGHETRRVLEELACQSTVVNNDTTFVAPA